MHLTSTLAHLCLSPVYSMIIIQGNNNIFLNISSFEFYTKRDFFILKVLVVIVAFLKLRVWCSTKLSFCLVLRC